MASHLASLWKWDFLELGNGLMRFSLPSILVPRTRRFLVTWSLQLSRVAKGREWLPSIIITITWLEIQKDTKRIEIHQSQTMTFWTLWSKRLFPNRSAKIIDGSKGRKRILAFKIRIRARSVFEKSSNHSCLYFMFYYKARMAQQEKSYGSDFLYMILGATTL